MMTRKITGVILAVHYLLYLIREIIYIPFYNSSKDAEIGIQSSFSFYRDLLDQIDKILMYERPIAAITFIIFFLTFLFERERRSQAVHDVNSSSTNDTSTNLSDQPSIGLNIISFLIPLVGLIIYLTERDKSPRKANSAGKAALWGVGITIILSLISFFVALSMISSIG